MSGHLPAKVSSGEDKLNSKGHNLPAFGWCQFSYPVYEPLEVLTTGLQHFTSFHEANYKETRDAQIRQFWCIPITDNVFSVMANNQYLQPSI